MQTMQKRWLKRSDAPPRQDGTCRWCCTEITNARRRTFCSDDCVPLPIQFERVTW